MEFKYLPKRVMVIWELITLILCGSLICLGAFLIAKDTFLWYAVLWLLGAFSIFMVFFYVPIYYVNYCYAINKTHVILTHGVLYNRVHHLKIDKISYVSVYKTPLARLLGLRTVIISAPGSQMRLLFIKSADAKELSKRLSPGRKFLFDEDSSEVM